jgi:hypothetical protein
MIVEERTAAQLAEDKLRAKLIAAKLAKANDLLAQAQRELNSAVREMDKDLPGVREVDARELQNLRTVLQFAVQRHVRATHAHWEGLAVDRSRP